MDSTAKSDRRCRSSFLTPLHARGPFMVTLAAASLIVVSAVWATEPIPTPQATSIEKADRIVIEKGEHRLTLYSKDRVLRTYRVAIGGGAEGAKTCAGDDKTPEGVYRISGRNTGTAYHRSLKISYPNERDRARAAKAHCKPGGDIAIHGLPNVPEVVSQHLEGIDWTRGCVAVKNSQIDEIANLVLDGTAVEIKP